jgi:CDP-diacylglycerol--glycerol-3-phosphate 3-phosphatidyltransferase
LVTGLRQIAIEAGQVLAADGLGKWKTTFQLAYLITGLIWLTGEKAKEFFPVVEPLKHLARPSWEGGWVQPVFLWAAVALTVISGWNYVWSGRRLLKTKSS